MSASSHAAEPARAGRARTVLEPTCVSVASSGLDAVDVARPVLVCGVGRSGTSLLHSMLNAHPALALPPETHFFRRYMVPRATRARLQRGTVAACARVLAEDADLARSAIPPDRLLAGERDGAVDVARVFRRLLALYAAERGKHRVGDKDPRNIDHLEALAATFPEGYLVHVLRDPRAVLLSRTRAAWSRGRPWWQHALLAEDQMRRGRAIGPRLFGPRYLEVRYEELVASPETTLRALARHVGLEYSGAMLEFSASAASLVDAREREWKQETLGPLLTGTNEKWRSGLSAVQVRFVEQVSREAFDGVGYPRSESAAAPGSRLAGSGLGIGVLARASRTAFALRRALEERG